MKVESSIQQEFFALNGKTVSIAALKKLFNKCEAARKIHTDAAGLKSISQRLAKVYNAAIEGKYTSVKIEISDAPVKAVKQQSAAAAATKSTPSVTKTTKSVTKKAEKDTKTTKMATAAPTIKVKELARLNAQLKEKHPDAIILIQQGNYYIAIGRDADIVSVILELKTERKEGIQFVAIWRSDLTGTIKKLVSEGESVAVAETIDKNQGALSLKGKPKASPKVKIYKGSANGAKTAGLKKPTKTKAKKALPVKAKNLKGSVGKSKTYTQKDINSFLANNQKRNHGLKKLV